HGLDVSAENDEIGGCLRRLLGASGQQREQNADALQGSDHRVSSTVASMFVMPAPTRLTDRGNRALILSHRMLRYAAACALIIFASGCAHEGSRTTAASFVIA